MKRYFTKTLLLCTLIVFSGISQSFAQPGIGIPFGFTPSTPVVVPPAFAGAIVTASAQDNSMIILSPAGFNFPFAGTTYPYLLTSTNGWVALLSASDLSASVATTTDSVAVVSGDSSVTVPNAALASIAVGMFVSGTNILTNSGYAQVINVDLVTKKVKLNVRFTGAVAAGAGTFNFFNLIPVYFNSSLPANQLSTYAGARPFITPLWDDLATSSFAYNLTGSVYSIRWTSKWDKANVTSSNLCWLRFDATPGATYGNIGFNYYNQAYTTAGTPSASIGIAGVCTGDYYSVRPTAPTTAAYDSTSSSDTLSGQGAGSLRFNNFSILWNPFSPNDNCSGTRLPTDLGLITSSCSFISASNVNATTSGSGMSCAAAEVKDVWFKFTKPPGVTSVIITTAPGSCQPSPGTTIEAWTSCGGTMLGCTTSGTTYPTFGELTLYRPSCNTEVIYVRVTGDGDVIGKFDICAKTNGNPPSPTGGTTCGNPTNICSLPYTQTGMTTAGSGNEYDSTNTVCHSVYAKGEDYIFTYTPAASQCVRITLTGPATGSGVFIYNNCPDSSTVGSPTYCLGSAEGLSTTQIINSVTLTAGVTYYIMVDNSTAGGNIPFNFSVTSLGTSNAYDNCALAVNFFSIGSGQSCTLQTYSTECSTPSTVGSVPVPSCISATGSVPRPFIDGVTGDVWLTFKAAFTGSLQISTQQSGSLPTTINAAMAIYTGGCGAFTEVACDYNSGPGGMPNLTIPVTNLINYWIRVWSENPESQGNFDICLSSACAPPNDLPCSAVNIPMGATITGFNTCSGGTNEPANAAQCVAGGTINTVWYKVIVPASGQVHIRTHPLTLTDTQIQAYTSSGAGCSNTAAFVSKGCNDNGPGCSGGFSDFSDLTISALTPNDTLYIAVDGKNSLTGSFEITVVDGVATPLPPVNQQDCAAAQIICSTASITAADPGYRNYGNICDLPGSFSCWGIGERNSIWYQFTVDPALSGGTASVAFDVLTLASTDIDVLMWDVTGLGNACASIQTNSLPAAACNFAASSASTGLTTAGTLPYAYAAAVTFSGAPRTYILLLNNYNSAANAGYTLNWGSTPISTATTSAVWSGGTVAADTNYTCSTCWGACGGIPTCGVDATINSSASGRQPTVSSNQSVKNITINAGAKLRIKSGFTLSVCGNFTNFGTLICEPGSTVLFIGNSAQTITGNLTGTNSFATLNVSKLGGTVTLANNIDVAENFGTLSGTSVFSINGKYLKVGGHFTNNNGNTTFTNIGGSTVEFNGALNQNFTNTNGAITLNRVKMNKLTGKLYLIGANSKMTIDTVLTMTRGNIVTRSNAALEVYLKYNISGAVVGHSAVSFIDGKLRRAVYNAANPIVLNFSLDFPLGDSLNPGGYNLANITFTSGTVIPDLLGYFSPWPSIPPPMGPTASECAYATYDVNEFLNNGFWTFSKTATSPFNGSYNITLGNGTWSNTTGSGWTVARADIAALPMVAGSWSLIGNCVVASTTAATQRTTYNSPANINTSFNFLLATAVSNVPLPIELISFTAEPEQQNVVCRWTTASETNNDYFEVQRSDNGIEFKTIGTVKGFGAGISTSSRAYKFIDDEQCHSLRYYRLNQIDIDAKNSVSDIVAVNCKNTDETISLYPNPASEFITYQFYQNNDEQLEVKILDITGREIKSEIVSSLKGFNTTTTTISELSAGVYYLQIRSLNPHNLKGLRQTQFFKN